MRAVIIKFDEAEAWLVAEALSKFKCEAPADMLRVRRMRDLIEGELAGGGKR